MDQPYWRDLHARAKFVSNVETGVERLHAQLHRNIAIAPRHNEAYQSVSMRRQEICRAVDEPNSGAVLELADYHSQANSALEVVESLGLQCHPCFAEHLEAGRVKQRVPHSLVTRVVYRGDLETQFSAIAPYFDDDGDSGNGAPPRRRETTDMMAPSSSDTPPADSGNAAAGAGGA